MRRIALAAAVLMTVTLAACGSADSGDSAGSAPAQNVSRPDGAAAEQPRGGTAAAPKAIGALGRATIRTADLSVRVDDIEDAARNAVRVAETSGGFLESEESNTERTRVTLRVPPEDFTATLDAVAKLGTTVSRNVSTKDVTNDVADVDGRLKSARASVARVRDLMNRAASLDEVTKLEAELNDREAELESLETRQRTLAGQTSYASVTATFSTTPAPAPKKKTEATGFTGGLTAGWDAFTETVRVVLVVVGALLPFGVTAALVLGLVLAVRRRLSARAAHLQ